MSDWIERWKWQAERRSKPHLRKVLGNWWCAQSNGKKSIAGSSGDMQSAYVYFKVAYARETSIQESLQGSPARDRSLDTGEAPKAAGDPFSAILGASWRDTEWRR